jgi:hypothetical protein
MKDASRVVTGYNYDVFISYQRRGETLEWVKSHFEPALYHSLAIELDRKPKIFVDYKLWAGTTWPVELGQKLATSRIIVSLWTRNYLKSDWCALELAHMLAREEETGRRSEQYPTGVIAIPIIHDGKTLPAELRMIQTFEVQKYFNPRMRKDSKKSERLWDVVSENAEALAALVEAAPEWKQEWSTSAVQDFYEMFRSTSPPE